jgi:predicted lipoprotein with Yx(FWY)xxD motif
MSHLVKHMPLLGAGVLALMAAVAVAVTLAASSSASMRHAPSASAASVSTTIRTRHTRIGTILVTASGDTLYAFSRDSRDRDACASIRGCPSAWPIMALHGTLEAGSGVNHSLLGSIRVGRSRQVTYAGHPLYSWTGNSGPGDVSYVGANSSGGRWPAVSPSGSLIR